MFAIRGDNIIKGSRGGGRAIKGTNESRLVRTVRIRKSSDRIKRLLVVVPSETAPRSVQGSLSRAGEHGSGTREPLINSYWSAGSRRVVGAVAMSSIFLLRVRTRTQARTHTHVPYVRLDGRGTPHTRRSCSKESPFTSNFTDRDSRRSVLPPHGLNLYRLRYFTECYRHVRDVIVKSASNVETRKFAAEKDYGGWVKSYAEVISKVIER